MIVCMVTPHLPPDQAANALLPQLLRDGLTREGHEVRLMAFEPRAGRPRQSEVRYIPRSRNGLSRTLRLTHLETAFAVYRQARGFFSQAEVVHVHSNTFMNQLVAALAYRRRVPFLLTHYGTEIWHYRKRPIDPFLWMNQHAAHVTYYSRLLLDKSVELGVVPPRRVVVYPPVEREFHLPTEGQRAAARSSLGLASEPLLLNVKRLHPLAGQRYLIEAMPEIRRSHPGARLFVVGEGEARPELEELITSLGLGDSVKLLGLVDHRELPRIYQAADLFVLPSRLEAFPTVAAEALACGLPVVSADHPGGRELAELFPDDVALVPREQVSPLAQAIAAALHNPRRSSGRSRERIERELRPEAAIARYLELYRSAIEEGARAGN